MYTPGWQWHFHPKMGFIKDQRHDCKYRSEVRRFLLEIQVVLYMFPCVDPPIVWATTESGDTWVAPHLQLEHLALMMCHILLQVPCIYCCVRMSDWTMCHSCVAPCRVLANDPWVVPTSWLGHLTLMVHHSAWSPDKPDSKLYEVDQIGHGYHGVNSDEV